MTPDDRITVSRAALEAALLRAGVPTDRVDRLIRDSLVSPDATTEPGPAAVAPPAAEPRSRVAVVLSYLGGLLVIGAMSVFLGQTWDAAGDGAGLALLCLYAVAFGMLSVAFRRRGLLVPSGLMATAVVALTPAIVFAFSLVTGFGEGTEYADYGDFYVWVSSQWFAMEVATIVVGIVALRMTDFSLVLAAVGTSFYFAAMDFAEVLFGNDPSDTQRASVAIILGLVGIGIGIAFDHVRLRDHAFWPHLFGVFSVLWGYGYAFSSASDIAQLVGWEALGVVFILFGAIAARALYIVVGGIAVFGATLWAASDLFGDALATPLFIAIIGLGLLLLGVRVQRNAGRYQRLVRDAAPAWLIDLIPLTEEEQNRFLRHGD